MDLPSLAALVSLVGKHVLGVVDDTVWIASTSARYRRGTRFAFCVSTHVKWVLCNGNEDDGREKAQIVCDDHFGVADGE